MADDKQTKEIKQLIPEGSTYYPATRCVISEWPQMATRGNGRGKGKTSKVCQNQEEYDAYTAGGSIEAEQETSGD